MTSDQVIWSEQGRLHLSYNGTLDVSANQITIGTDLDGNTGGNGHGIRVGDTILVSSSRDGATTQCYVKTRTAGAATIVALPYKAALMSDAAAGSLTDGSCTVMVYGSEFAKGTAGQTSSNKPVHKSFTNKPIILKDFYQINGSDTSQIGWVEISGEDGQGGYLWYLKAEGDTRSRFTDYVEMSMVESVRALAASTIHDDSVYDGGAGTIANTDPGTEGLFAAIEDRGNMSSGISGVNAATDLAEFDAILAEFDKQGAIEENMMFVNRATALAIDDMLASMNSYGAGGTSYGVFDNDEDMALNLGFSGFRRGSYDFYKSDWKYLNDNATRGGAVESSSAIRGVMVPAGVSTVYDQQMGKNLKRPFLHVRYRAGQTENRKMKTWITGSVGGAATTDIDSMNVHYLSERCLVVQGANNFMLLN
tara:strand:- start:278 stop:1540 length:1263 start_codon:yes stop_codon:yes gene_type:complete